MFRPFVLRALPQEPFLFCRSSRKATPRCKDLSIASGDGGSIADGFGPVRLLSARAIWAAGSVQPWAKVNRRIEATDRIRLDTIHFPFFAGDFPAAPFLLSVPCSFGFESAMISPSFSPFRISVLLDDFLPTVTVRFS